MTGKKFVPQHSRFYGLTYAEAKRLAPKSKPTEKYKAARIKQELKRLGIYISDTQKRENELRKLYSSLDSKQQLRADRELSNLSFRKKAIQDRIKLLSSGFNTKQDNKSVVRNQNLSSHGTIPSESDKGQSLRHAAVGSNIQPVYQRDLDML
jgi:hypothetical protein